jgi:2-aminoadipate transaminase
MAVGLRDFEHLFAARTRGGHGDSIAAVLALANARGIVSFAGGFPDPATYPVDAVADLLRGLDLSAFQYAPSEGLPATREFLAERLERLEGVAPAERGLLVTSGSMEVLHLVGKALLEPGDTVVVEGPTYMGAILNFQSFEAETVAIPMDAAGLHVDELERQLGAGLAPKLVYVIPDHQNPAGVSLALDRRGALVELARTHGFLILEDVAYRELGFYDERLPSLWSLAPDVVVHAGTFSKTFFPGVRLGWAAGPPEVVARLVWAKQLTDQCAGALGQRLLVEYGRRGLLDRQLERSRGLYARRCGLMLDALERHALGRVEWTRPRGGFFTWLTFSGDVDAVELAKRALEARVAFVPGSVFYGDGRGIHEARLSFSKVADEDIDVGVQRLASLLAA